MARRPKSRALKMFSAGIFRHPKVDAQIRFDKANSVGTFIISDDQKIKEKLAILLHNFTIAGKGQAPFYPREISLSLQCKGKWVEGTQFRPQKYKIPDSQLSDEEKVVFYMVVRDQFGGERTEGVGIVKWHDFSPKSTELPYGKPYSFSYAGLFNINCSDYDGCKKLKIMVKDYLDNSFETVVGAEFFNPIYKGFNLCMKPPPQCEADAIAAVSKQRGKNPS
jgi:hypothetical protein